MELSFVAELDGKIAGHIIYSNAYILQQDGSKIDVLNFGPVSVLPKLQKAGIGGTLIRHSIKEAKNWAMERYCFLGILNITRDLASYRLKNLVLPIAMATIIPLLWLWS